MQTTSTKTKRILFLCVFLAAFAKFLASVGSHGLLAMPPEKGDGPDYEALAYNIWQGNGFGVAWGDPEWRRPYLSNTNDYHAQLERHGTFNSSALRPPGLPAVIAATYMVAGRRFIAFRIVNCLAIAAAVALGALIADSLAGIWGGVLAGILGIFWMKVLAMYAERFRPEGLAMLGVTWLLWVWLKIFTSDRKHLLAITSGVLLGCLVAVRSNFALWLPMIFILNWVRGPGVARLTWKFHAICLGAALLVIGPWLVRNILFTGAFMPLGTMGGTSLVEGFSDQALSHNGIWAPYQREEEETRLISEVSGGKNQELWLCQYHAKLAKDWMTSHPTQVVKLMALHVWHEVIPLSKILCLLTAAGIAFFWRKTAINILLLFLLVTLGGVAMTWSVEGRFLAHLFPVMTAVSAAGVAMGVAKLRAWVSKMKSDPGAKAAA